jgi:hypothetical protein
MDGEKLAHEHIYWDQASVLAQLGLLDTEKLPVAGAEAAQKILDRTVPVNQLMKRLRASAAERRAQRAEGERSRTVASAPATTPVGESLDTLVGPKGAKR